MATLRVLLATAPDAELAGDASNGDEAVRLAASLQPDKERSTKGHEGHEGKDLAGFGIFPGRGT